MDESFLGEPPTGSFSLHSIPAADGSLELQVEASGVRKLKALYFRLEYDSQAWHPLSATATGRLNARPGSGLLDLAVLHPLRQESTLYHGQLLTDWPSRSGFSGSAALARIVLLPGPAPGSALRAAASAPNTPASRASILYLASSGTVVVYHCSQGDYDENGEVNIADLTPLGANFGAVGPFSLAQRISAIDGDLNGELNIADLTPIGMNFGVLVEGYHIYHSNSFLDVPFGLVGPNGPGATLVGSADMSTAGRILDQRLELDILLPGLPASGYLWARPYDGTDIGVCSSIAPYGGANTPPVVLLDATPLDGAAPLHVEFDASGTQEADGDPMTFTWDFNGDSVVDLDTGALATASHDYAFGGTYAAAVIVSDGLASSSAGVSITVSGAANTGPSALLAADVLTGPAPLTVNFDASGSTDAEAALAGYAYDFDGDGSLDPSGSTAFESFSYAAPGSYTAELRVTDSEGLSASDFKTIIVSAGPHWRVIVPFSASDDIGTHLSLAEVNGLPAVICLDQDTGTLLYYRGLDANGESWDVGAQVIDNSGTVQGSPSLKVVLGQPAVAYQRDNNLYFARANSADGMTLWGSPAPLALDNTGNCGAYASMEIVNGNPAIAYYHQTEGEVRFIRADSTDGSSWLNPLLTLDGSGSFTVGINCSLAVVGGLPMVSYQDIANATLGIAHSSDTSGIGGSWNLAFPVTGVIGGSATFATSLCDNDGLPAVAFSNEETADLSYILSQDINLTLWTSAISPAGTPTSTTGLAASLKMLGLLPCIAYERQGAGEVRFARAGEAAGASWDASELIDDGGDGPGGNSVGNYVELAEINGHPAVVYENAVSHIWNYAVFF